jgi:hypothetical protein
MPYQRPLRWIEMLDDLTSVEFLLSVKIAGRDFYFSTRPLVLYDETGEPIQFDGGLEAEWTDALNLFNESPTLLSIPLELYFSDDVAELVAKGHDLFRGTGELSLWIEGRPYEDRVVLIQGNVFEPSYGAKGEPVKFSLESNGFEDTNLTHDSLDRVTPRTFSQADDAAMLQYYPIVFGTPGIYNDGGSVGVMPGSPAPAVDVSGGNVRFLAAGHEVFATEATFINVTKDPVVSLLISLEKTEDNGGKTVTTSVPIPIGAGFFDLGDEVWIAWEYGGALLNDRKNGARAGAGELLSYFLRRTSLGIDTGAWEAIYPELNINYRFSGYVNDAVSVFDYVRDNFFPLLPISVYTTAEGVSASLWRRESTKADAVGTITTGGGVARVDLVQYENQQIANNITINYALNAATNEPERATTVLGDPKIVDTVLFTASFDDVLFSTEYARASFLRFGNRYLNIETDIIYEDATASNVLQWKHRAAALPYRVISYDVPIRLGFLRRGDLVLLTDSELYLTEYLAFVRDIIWTDAKPRLVLVLVEDGPREDRLN